MKLGTIVPYLKNHVTSALFHWKSANFAISGNTYIDCILVHFFQSWKAFLINKGKILLMSAKLPTPGLLKIKIFKNEVYDDIIADYDVTSKMLSRDSNYVAHVVMWPKFGNSSIPMREVIITSRIWPEKPLFFEVWPRFKFNNLGLALVMKLKFYTSVVKGLKLKFRKFWGISPTFVEVTGEKLVGESSWPPILNWVNSLTLSQSNTIYLIIHVTGDNFFWREWLPLKGKVSINRSSSH